MNQLVTKRETCRLCNSRNLELVLKLASTPIGDAYVTGEHLNEAQPCYPLELFICKSCGLSQLLSIVDPKHIYREYIYHTSDSLGLVEHFRKYAEAIINSLNPPRGSLVIDIGSNDGCLLSFFKDNGMKVLGIDPAIEIAKQATKSGIETLPAFFTGELAGEIKKRYGSAYIITANNTIANIDNLTSFIQSIREILSEDGFFIFETGYFLDWTAKYIFDNIYHEHMSYFSVAPLKKFLSNNGMELIDVQRISTKGGSIRCIAQLKGGPRKISPAIQQLIELEAKKDIHNPESIKAFAVMLENIKSEFIKLLQALKAEGKKIAGYGASVGVTTVLYNFSIDNALLDFIVDDNQQRQNLYSPGLHIPVLPPKEIYDKKIDYVVILAWQYAQPIINKHKAYLESGGHFITFLPKIEIFT